MQLLALDPGNQLDDTARRLPGEHRFGRHKPQFQPAQVKKSLVDGHEKHGQQLETQAQHQIVLIIRGADPDEGCSEEEKTALARDEDEKVALIQANVSGGWDTPVQPALVATPADLA